jgi:hypothetical protein
MSQVTPLASGQVTAADTLSVELVETIEPPTVVLLRWSAAPSVTDPNKFPTAARAVVSVLAEARAALAKIKAAGT